MKVINHGSLAAAESRALKIWGLSLWCCPGLVIPLLEPCDLAPHHHFTQMETVSDKFNI